MKNEIEVVSRIDEKFLLVAYKGVIDGK